MPPISKAEMIADEINRIAQVYSMPAVAISAKAAADVIGTIYGYLKPWATPQSEVTLVVTISGRRR